MTTAYRKALEDAQKELLELETQIAVLSQRRAQLEQTIASLKLLMGESDEGLGITDSIQMVLEASREFLSADEVSKKLQAFLPNVNPVSVSSILSRLASEKRVITGTTERGRTGYKWNRDVSKIIASLAALSQPAEGAKKKKS